MSIILFLFFLFKDSFYSSQTRTLEIPHGATRIRLIVENCVFIGSVLIFEWFNFGESFKK